MKNKCRKLIFLLFSSSRVDLFVKKQNCRNLSLIIAHVSGFKSEWNENFDGFHKTTCGFLWNRKGKITEFGDQQASKIGVRTKYVLIRCSRATNLRGQGTPAGIFESLKGSPKFLFGRPTLRSGRLN